MIAKVAVINHQRKLTKANAIAIVKAIQRFSHMPFICADTSTSIALELTKHYTDTQHVSPQTKWKLRPPNEPIIDGASVTPPLFIRSLDTCRNMMEYRSCSLCVPLSGWSPLRAIWSAIACVRLRGYTPSAAVP